jgi:FACT complex subunit SPT16
MCNSTTLLDILFENIRHVIFQSCQHESQVILHFNLKAPLFIGKKRTFDVQIFRDVLDNVVDETSGSRKRINYADEDEIAEELEESRRREEADVEFRSFGEKLARLATSITMEIPNRERGFTGVISRQSVLLQPTLDSLVFLLEPPFFVTPWEDIEVAYLERVMFGLRNFDMVLVWKDHEKEPFHITSIPMTSLESVKDLLR